jgi:hypothetical protein
MDTKLTPEMVRNAAELIGLELLEDEVEPVRERLQILLDSTSTFAHLTSNTSDLDVRFDARWEVEQA